MRRLHRLAIGWAGAAAVAMAGSAAPPGEVQDLVLAAGGASVAWSPVAGATAYRLYQGDRSSCPDLATPVADSCLLGTYELAESGPILDEGLPPGDFRWFVATALNADGEGSEGPGRQRNSWGECCGAVAFADDFAGSDGGPWPPRWSGRHDVADADLAGGGGRWRPVLSGYSLARLVARAELSDVEVTFRIRFDDILSQGIGLYVRSNGGYLGRTSPPGQGYAVFIEGFRGVDGIGVWREVLGSEESIRIVFDDGLGLDNGQHYRVRFRVTQSDAATTRLQARIWREGETEPGGWILDETDRSPALQGVAGSIAVDSWSSYTTGGPVPAYTHIDDIRVRRLCDPTAGAGLPAVVEEGFQFTEGPVYTDGALYFSDIDADTIYALAEPGPATVHRQPSGRANGLAAQAPFGPAGGALLACEHVGRRVSRQSGAGGVSTLVDNWRGLRFNSPNDLVLRWDGTLYFSDPPYGLADPADREIPFNGLFRLPPGGDAEADWQGDAAASRPNGVLLSPDQRTLYLSDSAAGSVVRFPVGDDGRLGAPEPFAAGLNVPDGMCGDEAGNVYVATWASTIEVFAPDGSRWGSLAVPRPATNCAFGGPDRTRLYVTAQDGVYRFDGLARGR